VNNPALAPTTSAGETAFLKFLRSQVAAIGDVLKSGSLNADDQAKAISALSHLYTADQGSDTADTPTAGQTNDPGPGVAPPLAPPSSVDPSLTDPGLTDPGLGQQMPMPDPSLSDLGLGNPMGPDPLSSLASMLPAAGGVSPLGGGGSPLDGLSGLAGAAAPLAGLASQLGDQVTHPDDAGKDSHADDRNHDTDTADTKDNKDKDSQSSTQAGQPQAPVQAGQQPPSPEPAGAPGQGAPPAAPAGAPASTAVTLPDGSSANAKTPALASAVKSYLAGTPLDAAYRQANIELPPPGTPITNPVDPGQLTAGYLGMFKDHYVVALSAAKALKDGQVVSLASAASGPDFLGWIDPSALAAGQQPAATPTAASLPPAPAPQATLAAASAPTG
jgi:hypothetical protein